MKMNRSLFGLALFLVFFPTSVFAKLETCAAYKSVKTDCFSSFQGSERKICEVCRDGKSCFSSLPAGLDQDLCRAYLEGSSCFSTIADLTHRAWCTYMKEQRTCAQAFTSNEKNECEKGNIPESHIFWGRKK